MARLVVWVLGCALVTGALGVVLGPRGVPVGIALAVVATVALVMWLPRAAHAAFVAGRIERATRRYRVLALFAFTRARGRASRLSLAGCALAAGRTDAAAARLAAIDGAALDPAERVVWLNNRACAALDGGGDPRAALALAEEAIGLRPDVPAAQHTRARALLAVGRVDEAIGVLDAMRAGGELAAALEAERCRELASAWERKGQRDYAEDYRNRARQHAR